MIYVTGDTHSSFRRFARKQREKMPFFLTEKDYMIVCGDLGLLWRKDRELEYNLDWFSRIPFTLLWVQGNHENYNMIAEYPLETWNGGKVRHIIRDKIILLERGQVFQIEDKTFFTFGGASSHDIQGGVLDRTDPAYEMLKFEALKKKLPYRILNESWWKQELPTEEEMQEGRKNLEKVNYKIDYVISHCMSTTMQETLEALYCSFGFSHRCYEADILTDYFEELEQKLQYKHWYCGHYHVNQNADEKHTVLYEKILPIGAVLEEDSYF